jgi:glycosyltransferase involved in cell wall biosynthesis
MEGQPRGRDQPRGRFTDDATRALRAFMASRLEPVVVGYHPVVSLNPYQDLLYQRSFELAVAALPIVRQERIAELAALAERGFASVLHLHWLNTILADAGSSSGARKATEAFLRDLDAFRGSGGRIAWTVHNVLPHGARFEDEEARLATGVIERSDLIHVLAPTTAAHVGGWYRLPEDKLLTVEHPSYIGAYEDWVTRERARHDLGIMPDELVYAVVGRIRPYKGLTELLDAWDGLEGETPRRLLIAGEPTDEPGVSDALDRAAAHPRVILHARPIPPQEIQWFLRAADVAVLPYLRSLNSGAQMLALTFGLPVIVPSGGALTDVTDQRYARTFDPTDHASLVRALRDAGDLATQDARTAAREEAERRAPSLLSLRFTRGLRERLGLAAPETVGEVDRWTEPDQRRTARSSTRAT